MLDGVRVRVVDVGVLSEAVVTSRKVGVSVRVGMCSLVELLCLEEPWYKLIM